MWYNIDVPKIGAAKPGAPTLPLEWARIMKGEKAHEDCY